jgi:hypothetical protein
MDRLIKATPANAELKAIRGQVLEILGGDSVAAIAAYSEALDANVEKKAITLNNRARAYFNLAEYGKSIADSTAALAFEPNAHEIYATRASAHVRLKQFDGAVKDYTKALALKPDDQAYHMDRAASYLFLDDLKSAEADLAIVRGFPQVDTAALQRAEALFAAYRAGGVKQMTALVYGDQSAGHLQLDTAPDAAAADKLAVNDTGEAEGAGSKQSLDVTLQAPPDLGRRVALVIGNGAYGDGMALPNPPNDAKAMAATLGTLGFDVVTVIDGTRSAMTEAMYQFATKAEGADAAMVFYAGHGMQVDNVNYLMPIDASLESRADLKHKFIKADTLIDDLASVKGMRMVVLDACRNNPLSRSIKVKLAAMTNRAVDQSAGLADMKAEGVLIAFATQPNEVASDGVGTQNSPFTTALLKHMQTPGIEIDTMFKRVRTDVSQVTDGVQLPQTVNSSIGEFYLVPQ